MSEPDQAVTFAVPFHNDLALLEETLGSVLAQSSPHWSVLVVDNAPEDLGARALVASLGDPRLACVRNDRHLPIGANWNRCLELAEGALVTILHADDLLLPGYVERMLAGAARHPEATALFCRARPVGPDGTPTRSAADLYKTRQAPRPDPGTGDVVVAGERGARALVRGNFIVCSTLCYRTAGLGGRRFSDRWRFVLDLDFALGLVMDGGTLVGVPEVGLDYRIHEGSETSRLSRDLTRFREEADFLGESAAALEALGWRRAAAVARRRGVPKLHLAYRIARDLVGLRWGAAGPKAGLLVDLMRGR